MKYNRESEQRYNDFIENLNDIAYETDKLGNVTYCNKIAEEYVGVTREKIIGYNFLPFFSEEDGKLAIENHTKTLNGESPTFELTFIHSGKTPKPQAKLAMIPAIKLLIRNRYGISCADYFGKFSRKYRQYFADHLYKSVSFSIRGLKKKFTTKYKIWLLP